jgi:hypothetical protein
MFARIYSTDNASVVFRISVIIMNNYIDRFDSNQLSMKLWSRVDLAKTDISDEHVASIFKVEEIYVGEENC